MKRRTRLSWEDAERKLKEGLQVLSAVLRSVEELRAENQRAPPLSALHDSPVNLRLNSGLKKVVVYMDYEEGQISFYNVEDWPPLFSFTGHTGKLCLLLNPQASETIPMVLFPLSD